MRLCKAFGAKRFNNKCYLYAVAESTAMRYIPLMSKKSFEENLLLEIGQRIRFFREKKGWSQEELAFNCALHRTYIGAVERGERNISVLSLQKIALAMGLQIRDFFSNPDEDNKIAKVIPYSRR